MAAHSRSLKIVALVAIVVACIVAGIALHEYDVRPWTDDASIDADVVHLGATVGGRVLRIGTTENATVARGQLIFQLDQQPFELAIEQAQASLDLAVADLETRRRTVANQKEQTLVAREQTRRSVATAALDDRTVDRLAPLEREGYVTTQQLDDAVTKQHQSNLALRQATVQEHQSLIAVDTDDAARALVAQRTAALHQARYNLAQSTVVAPQDGRVVGLAVTPGEILSPSQSLFTLVASDEWFANANFRETQLKAIRVGDCVTVYSMIDRSRAMRGTVQGVGSGVGDGDRVNLPRSVPIVERSLNWVRVEQRFPVRIRITQPPAELVRLGASAVVQVGGGSLCPDR